MRRDMRMKRFFAFLAAATIGLCLVGCSGGSAPSKSIEAGGMTINYPESWGEAETMEGGQILGVRATSASIVKPEGAEATTVIALADASGSDLKIDTLEKTLTEQAGLKVEETQADGKNILRATGDSDGTKVFAIVAHDDGALKAMMVVTIASSDYEKDSKTYDAVIDSVKLS